MSDDYVEWDVHATTDAFTPRVEYDDPLQQFSESESQYYSSYNNTGQLNSTSDGIESIAISSPPLPPIIPSSSSPILDSLDSLPKTSPSPQSQQSSNLKRNGSPSVPIAPPPAAAAVEVELLPMTITISDAKKQENPQGAYVTYLVTTTTSVETFSVPNPRPVRRRYQDFVWLHTALTLEYPACIVPPLPEKHRLEYIKGDRFSPEFIKRRQISLQWFLDRLSRHPYLQKSQCTRIFLESTDFRNDKRSQIRHIPQSSSIFDTLSDTLVNAFAKIRKPDEKFEEMKELVGKLEDNLNIVERLYMRINKRQQDLQNDYTNFATSLQGLSSLESNITNSLHQFAETSKAYSKAMQEMTEKEEMQFLNEIHALLAYCSAAKEVLKARDQKQLDFEELSNYLQQTIHERERTQFPGRKYNDRGGSVVGGGMQITEYVTDKINEVRGVNMEKLRREKLSNLERRINELREEVTKANDESNGFSSQVVKEFEVFQKTKTLELKQGLIAYADCHIAFYEKGTAIWANILPVLENIDGVKGDGNSTDAAQL